MRKKQRLYDDDTPVANFNSHVLGWLEGLIQVREHAPCAAFDDARAAYDEARAALEAGGLSAAQAHRRLLTELTDLMMGNDLSATLMDRLSSQPINERGVRTALAQGFVKNTGENFINLLVYALADVLSEQDRVLVDKGMPRPLRPLLTLERVFETSDGARRSIDIPIECDIAIWDRYAPENAIVLSAKTRLKEVFHIGTMWKLLYDMLGDEYCLKKWRLKGPDTTPDMLYVFATADMVPKGNATSQGGDVERDSPRNLIAMDASFFDYVFVSKRGISHVAEDLDLAVIANREALFHELGCILQLIQQRFDIDLKLA